MQFSKYINLPEGVKEADLSNVELVLLLLKNKTHGDGILKKAKSEWTVESNNFMFEYEKLMQANDPATVNAIWENMYNEFLHPEASQLLNISNVLNAEIEPHKDKQISNEEDVKSLKASVSIIANDVAQLLLENTIKRYFLNLEEKAMQEKKAKNENKENINPNKNDDHIKRGSLKERIKTIKERFVNADRNSSPVLTAKKERELSQYNQSKWVKGEINKNKKRRVEEQSSPSPIKPFSK